MKRGSITLNKSHLIRKEICQTAVLNCDVKKTRSNILCNKETGSNKKILFGISMSFYCSILPYNSGGFFQAFIYELWMNDTLMVLF